MRSKRIKKKQISPDAIYKSRVVTRLINYVMLHGKKAVAEDIVYSAIGRISEDRKDAAAFFEKAVKELMPKQEVRSRRVGGATYQVPVPVKHDRAEALALRWLVDVSRGKKGKPMADALFEELNHINEGIGDALKKRDDTHKMAEANRAFAHFRF